MIMKCIVFLWIVLIQFTTVSEGIGTLGTVGSLSVRLQEQNNTLSLTWTAPSIPANKSADGLSYCVQVVEASSASVLHSECAINATEFHYPSFSPGNHCLIYNFTVIAVNSAGNGTERVVSYINATGSEVIAIQPRLSHESNASIIIYELNMTAPICSGRVLLEDINTSERVLRNVTVTVIFTFSSAQLTPNCRYNVSVTAENSAGSVLSYTILSTHDITGFRLLEQVKKTRVSVSYSTISPATVGALIAFVFISNNSEVDFNRSTLLALNRSASLNYSLPFRLFTGVYQVSLFDIDQSSTLTTGVLFPAITETFSVTGAGQGIFQPFNTDRCSVTSSQLSITANCMYPSSITSFQLIAQLMHAKKVHRLFVSTSGRLSAATVAVEEDGLYQVSVFFIGQDGILGSGVADYSVVAHLVRSHNRDVNNTVDETTTEAKESFPIDFDLLRILPFVFGAFVVVGAGGIKSVLLYVRYRKLQRQRHTTPAQIVVPASNPHADVNQAEFPPTYTANYNQSEQQHTENQTEPPPTCTANYNQQHTENQIEPPPTYSDVSEQQQHSESLPRRDDINVQNGQTGNSLFTRK